MKSKKYQRGISLIEAMAAIAIFSLGMLGQVAFMMTSMKNTQQSRYRAVASYYAEEIIGMAIADVSNRSKYTVSATTCSDTSWAPCTQWIDRLKADLPQISGNPVSVTLDNTASSADYGKMVVSIQWRAASGSNAQQFTTTTNLNLISQ